MTVRYTVLDRAVHAKEIKERVFEGEKVGYTSDAMGGLGFLRFWCGEETLIIPATSIVEVSITEKK